MNWLDFLIIFLMLGFTFSAYSSGLIREVLTLIAVLMGIIIARFLYDDLAKDVLVFMDDEDVAGAIAFLVLFGCVYLLGQISAYVLKRGASLLMLGWINSLGGAFFGFIKGLVVVQVLLIIFAAYPSLHLDNAIDNSEIGRFFVDDASFLKPLLPGEFGDRVDAFLSPEDAAE